MNDARQNINLFQAIPKPGGTFPTYRHIFLCYFVLIILSATYFLHAYMSVNQLVNTVVAAEQDLIVVKKKFEEMLKLSSVDSKKGTVVAILKKNEDINYTSLYEYYYALAKNVPYGVWINNIEINIQKNTFDIALSATSTNYMYKYFSNLRKDSTFKKVGLSISHIDKNGSVVQCHFTKV